jgi:CBS domain-containing protein
MKVRQIMTDSLQTCSPEDTLKTAAQSMWDRDIGSLPVCDSDGRVIGMLTDRDICMHACFEGKALDALRVGDAMSRDARCCSSDDSLERAEQIMRDARVRRLPVIG